MAFTVVALLTQKWLLGRKRFTTLSGRAVGAKPIELGPWKWALLAFCLIVVFLSLLLPVSTLVISSFLESWGEPISWENLTLESYIIIADSPDVYTAVSNGLRLSFAAATTCVLLAMAIVWLVERTEIPGRGLLSFLSMVPFAFPSVALAVGLILVFIHPPFELYGTLWIIFVGYTIKRIAFAYIFARNALKQLDPEMEEAARVLGAGWLRTMGEVTLPLMKAGLAAAWVLIFSISLRELTMSILFYLPGTETMAVIVFNYFEDGTFEVASAISVVILVISFASVYLVKSVIGKGVQEV
jgi:iron(III) transport system permease protein